LLTVSNSIISAPGHDPARTGAARGCPAAVDIVLAPDLGAIMSLECRAGQAVGTLSP
jgi:hypothetical protein